MNIYEINEFILEEDKPYIDEIVDSINELISYNLSQQNTIFFYDTTDITDQLTKIQSNRIADQVIKYFRKRGIKITIANKQIQDEINQIINTEDNALQEINNGMYYAYLGEDFITFINYKSYNFVRDRNYIFQIKLNIRLGREYMKSYC